MTRHLPIPEPGTCQGMDLGHIDFERLHRLYEADSFFVTRVIVGWREILRPRNSAPP